MQTEVAIAQLVAIAMSWERHVLAQVDLHAAVVSFAAAAVASLDDIAINAID